MHTIFPCLLVGWTAISCTVMVGMFIDSFFDYKCTDWVETQCRKLCPSFRI